MSTLNGIGTHRLSYKAESFATGLTVTAYLWSPALVKSALQTFTEVSDGMYYLDYNFAAAGTYFGVFYENGVAKTVGTWRIVAMAELVNAEVLDVLNVDVLVAGVSFAEALRRIGAKAAGNISGAGTGTETIADWADSVHTIVCTVDASGNITNTVFN